jgi:hypothetical protein
VGWVDGDWGEQGVDFGLVVVGGVRALVVVQLSPGEDVDTVATEVGEKLIVPAGVLGGDEIVDVAAEVVQRLGQSSSVLTALVVTLFKSLENGSEADFVEFVEVAGRDSEELHSLEQRIAFVLSFLQDAAIKGQPRLVAVEVSILQSRWTDFC